jgi:hypothetical protein
MMRRILAATILALAVALLAPSSSAELVSKSYMYKSGITLELGIGTDDGLRIDSVRFFAPANGGGMLRTGDSMRAEVAISNASEQQIKVGVAIALFDKEERLLGVASGGTKLVPVKSGRQKSYTLIFDHVNTEAPRAATFQISLESKR